MTVARGPVSPRQRAVYRRRRLAVSGLGLLVVAVLVQGVQGASALIAGAFGGGESATTTALVDPRHAPVRIDVPATGLSEPLQVAGLEDTGLEPPAGKAAWFTGLDRVVPGELGTAVVAAQAGEGGAFAELTTVDEGDRVVITFADGVTLVLDVVATSLIDDDELHDSHLIWGVQHETRRVAVVTPDEVPGQDGHLLVVAELA